MTPDLTAAREALAAADTAVPPSEWWEIACSDGHELNHCDSEDEASATFNEKRGCDNDGCHARVELHHIKWSAQLPRWSFVDAAHLRAALAAVDELTRERDELRAALAEALATAAIDQAIATGDRYAGTHSDIPTPANQFTAYERVRRNTP